MLNYVLTNLKKWGQVQKCLQIGLLYSCNSGARFDAQGEKGRTFFKEHNKDDLSDRKEQQTSDTTQRSHTQTTFPPCNI